MLVALTLWSLSHLFPNGDLAHLILFDGFAATGLAAMPAFDARARRALSPLEARAYFAATSALSFRPLLDRAWWGATQPLGRRVLIAVGVWIGLLLLHPVVIGISPQPL